MTAESTQSEAKAARRDDASAAALRLVRLAVEHNRAATPIPVDLLPTVCTTLARMAAGLLADLADATGTTAGVLLDRIETATMDRAARR